MIVIVKKGYKERQLEELMGWIKNIGLDIHLSKGENTTILGLVGDTGAIDIDLLRSMEIVENVKRIQEPYKNVNRKFHPDNTIVNVCGNKFGETFQYIGGPCSVESEEQIISIAKEIKSAGGTFLRGGAFKPRSSPYAFQGLKKTGIEMLLKAKYEVGLPIVTEILDIRNLDLFVDVDIIQVGARNMQNFELLKELGKLDKAILLKRGLANTIEEWLMSAEYIISEGNSKIILCERGIRTFESYTRNTLDLSAVPLVKELTHLPIIVDPSHATGIARLVKPLSIAAAGVGSDGIMIEVHNNPPCALCDGAQSVKPEVFKDIVEKIEKILPLIDR